MTEGEQHGARSGSSSVTRDVVIALVPVLATFVLTQLKVPVWAVLIGVAVVVMVAVIVFVKPVRRLLRRAAFSVWSQRPVPWRWANQQALAVANADQGVIKAQDGVIKEQSRKLVDALALLDVREREHQDEVDRLAKAKDDAEEHLNLFIPEAEYSKQRATKLQLEVDDLRNLRTQIRNVTAKLKAAEQRASTAERDLKQEQNQVAALKQAATTHQEHLAEAFEKARSWEQAARAATAENVELRALVNGVEDAPQATQPVPQPRWRIFTPWDDPTEPLRLVNLVPGSVTRQVRIESDDDYYRINDAGYWGVIDGGDGKPFDGMLTKLGRQQGATIWIYWVDEDGENRQDTQKIDAVEDPPPVSYDAWGTPDI